MLMRINYDKNAAQVSEFVGPEAVETKSKWWCSQVKAHLAANDSLVIKTLIWWRCLNIAGFKLRNAFLLCCFVFINGGRFSEVNVNFFNKQHACFLSVSYNLQENVIIKKRICVRNACLMANLMCCWFRSTCLADASKVMRQITGLLNFVCTALI